MDECTSKTSKESSEIKLSTSCYSSSWIIHSFSQCCMFRIGTSLVYFCWNRITQNQCFTKSLVYFLTKITLDQIQKILHYIKFRNIFLIHRVHKLHYRIKIRNYTSTSTSEINLVQDFPNSNPVHQVQKYIYSVSTWESAVVHPLFTNHTSTSSWETSVIKFSGYSSNKTDKPYVGHE